MPEAEVALLLAQHLLGLPNADAHAEVAIDGASILAHGTIVFDIERHMESAGWRPIDASTGRNSWTCTYTRNDRTLRVHSRPGVGDVVASVDGRRVIAECKKGPPQGKKGSPERPLLSAALDKRSCWLSSPMM